MRTARALRTTKSPQVRSYALSGCTVEVVVLVVEQEGEEEKTPNKMVLKSLPNSRTAFEIPSRSKKCAGNASFESDPYDDDDTQKSGAGA